MTKVQVDLQNFEIIFRRILEAATFPCMDEYSSLIHWHLKPPGPLMALITGPGDSSATNETCGPYASAKSISTYPLIPGRPYREGDPICDRYQVQLNENSAFICVTDGCNWGEKPRRAARLVNKSMRNYINKHIAEQKTVREAVQVLLAALADAHLSVFDGREETWISGGTTAVAGLILEIDMESSENEVISGFSSPVLAPTKWIFVCVNVGDCKVLHYSPRTRKISDVTSVSRYNSLDATDPGGRLGSFQEMMPDLRNLCVFWIPVEEKDILMAMSDGVHDNLDPQFQGLSPQDFGYPSDNWQKAPPVWVSTLKNLYLPLYVQEFFIADDHMTPEKFQTRLTEYCYRLTSQSRNYLVTNPASRIPCDYQKYPGKLDHTTIACVQVGNLVWDKQEDPAKIYPLNLSVSDSEPTIPSYNDPLVQERIINTAKQQLTGILGDLPSLEASVIIENYPQELERGESTTWHSVRPSSSALAVPGVK